MHPLIRATVSTILFGLCSQAAFAEPKEFRIEAQDATTALTQFAKQANRQILFQSDRVKGVTTNALTGRYEPTDAIAMLLKDTGLRVWAREGDVLVVDMEGQAQMTGSALEASAEPGTRVAQADAASTGSVPARTAQGQGGNIGTAERQGTSQDLALEEIVVTAQKREERLQDVPVPVTVLSAENLSSTSQLRMADYYASVPGLDMHAGPAQAWQINIRGVSSGSLTENPSVGTVIDDIPFSSSLLWGGGGMVPELDPGNLAQIEVLRGPQGTLYGAGSLAGLLKYVTIDPSTDQLTGRVQVGSNTIKGGNDAGYSVRGSVNVPLSDTIAIRASGFNYVQPGFIDNVATGQDDVNEVKGKGGRLSGLWRATDAVTLKLSALVQRIEPQGTWNTNGALGDLKQDDTIGAGVFERDTEAYSATLTAKWGPAEITSLSGYSRFDFRGTNPLALDLYVTDDSKSNKLSQELRLRMPLGERVEWLMGGFYTKERYTAAQGLPFVDPVTGAYTGARLLDSVTARGSHEELAAFTNLTFEITDRFDVQVGGRQAHYDGDVQQVWIGPLAPAGIIPAQLGSPYFPPYVTYKDDAFTYLVTPRFKLSPDWMVYARLASGYRTGGPNSTLGNNVLPIMEPDSTQNYEIGTKGSLLNGRLTVDLSAYYIDWADMQVFTTYRLPNGIPAPAYVNGPDARSQGVEASFEMRPWQGLKLALWGAWNDAELTGNVPAQIVAFDGRPGDQLPDTARFTGHFSMEKEFVLREGLTAYLSGDVSYRGKRISGFVAGDSGLPRVTLPSYAETDLNTGARFNTWEIGLYVNNLLDKRAGVAFSPLTGTGQPNQPRTIGLTLTKSFE